MISYNRFKLAQLIVIVFLCSGYCAAQSDDEPSKQLDYSSIKTKEDFPKHYFDVTFNNGETISLKYLEVGEGDILKYHLSALIVNFASTNGSTGFGTLFKADFRPIKYLRLSGYAHVPYVHISREPTYWSSVPGDEGIKRFKSFTRYFLACVNPGVYFDLKSKVKIKTRGLMGGMVNSYTAKMYRFKLPTYVTHSFGVVPTYYYVRGSLMYDTEDTPYDMFAFKNHSVGLTVNYQRTAHTVLHAKSLGVRRYSSVFTLYGGPLYGAGLNYLGVITDTTGEHTVKQTIPVKDRIGFVLGVNYKVTGITAAPMYWEIFFETGSMPGYKDHFHMNFGGVLTFHINKPYGKRPGVLVND